MSQPTNRKKVNRGLLTLVFATTVVFHVLGIASLQGMKIFYDSPEKSWFEQQSKLTETEKWDKEQERLKLERTEELATIFNQIIDKPVAIAEETIEVDLNEAEPEFVDPPLDSDLDLAGTDIGDIFEEIAPSEPIDHNFPVISAEQLLKEEFMEETVDFTAEYTLVLAPTENHSLTEELAQATSSMLGDILVEDPETISTEAGIKVGLTENAALDGTALISSSGFLEEGVETPVLNALPKIAPSFQIETSLESASIEKEDVDKAIGEEAVKHQLLVNLEDFIQFDIELMEPELEEKLPEINIEDLDNIATIASSEDFNLDVQYVERKDGEGYIFRIAFVPKLAANFKRIKQNMYFLIDRSHSISEERYRYTIDAVSKTLGKVKEGDHFNILVFDKKVVRLASKPLPWTEQNIKRAQAFLRQLPHGGFFATTDLYASLDKIVPDVVADTEVNTAILLSDGDTYLKRDMQRKTIGEWTRKNDGKVSLFSLASGTGNNLPLLQLLSSFNKGFLLYSPTDQEMSKTMQSLVHGISFPIGKDIIVTAVPSDESTKISLYPRTGQLPDLYENIPYVIYGSTNKMADFHIFLQGKYYDKWLDIKQKVSFASAKQGNVAIERNWTVRRAYNQYYHYLTDGDYRRLQVAKELLTPYNVDRAFK